MSMQFEMQRDGIRRNPAIRDGLHDQLICTAEARRLQAEAIAKAVHWVWAKAQRVLRRLMNGKRTDVRGDRQAGVDPTFLSQAAK